jgi:DNA-binding transcriptional regulator GbsR (MarR family)
MPGSRLTHDDRRQIAGWLADGLGYAEIARRLGRPTSTISREVARNLGTNGYLADHAQRSTGQRARRRKPATKLEPAGDGWPSDQARGYVDEFAGLLASTGLPRMPARIFACLLVVDSEGMTAADLVRRLRVSPASVSKAIGYLEAMDLVTRRTTAGGRRERYLVDDEVWLRAWRTDTGVHEKIAEAARRGVELFGAGTPAGARLEQLGEFFGWLSGQMSGSTISDAAALDALTVVAALGFVVRPLTAAELAAALSWSRWRVATAIDALDRRPDLADPFVLQRARSGAYGLGPRPDRLSGEQREALRTVISA